MKSQQQDGFTLVEVLVATTLLSIVIVIVVSMSLQFFGTQRIARDQLYVEGTARQAYALMIERTRESLIDYTYYDDGAPASEPERFLALRTEDREQMVFWWYDDSGNQLLFLCDGKAADEECDHSVDPTVSSEWDAVLPSNVIAPVSRFSTIPTSAPYNDTFSLPVSDQSPLVTMVMQLQLLGTDTTSDVLQTAITPRLYVR